MLQKLDDQAVRNQSEVEQYVRLVKGRNANLQETENHIQVQRSNGDDVSLISFYAEKFGMLNDQIMAESDIP